jgi:hypothetical protein
MLYITTESCIAFRDEWVELLRTLPYDQFGEYIRSTIYPALSDKDQKLWNRATISNQDLCTTIQTTV